MRLEGQSKLGYYPTPETSLKLILTWLSISSEGLSPKGDPLTGTNGLRRRYLDSCAGKGEALAAIAAAHGQAETFGIELSDVRATEARRVLTHVINTGYEYAVLTDETFSLTLLNPPYDGSGETGGGTRLEEVFLLNTTSRIVPGGILIYIIPHARLDNDKIARHLLGWYADLRCFKLAEEDYPAFKQIVVFGVRRAEYKAPTGEAMREVMEGWTSGHVVSGYTETVSADKKKIRQPVFADMSHLSNGNGEYVIPMSPLKGRHGAAFKFQYQVISDEDMLREADEASTRLDASREWADLVPPTTPPIIEPAMTPKRGHIAMQVSGGLLGTNLVRNADGRAMLLKGNVRKYTVLKKGDLESEKDYNPDDDKPQLRKVEVEEKFENLLTTLESDGSLVTHTEPATIGDLLNQYVAQLAEIVEARNVPQYDMKPETWEWVVFDNLSKGRTLPGRTEAGLTDFQKHLTVALGRLCLRHGSGFVTAEMGSGKAQPLHAKLLTPEGWRLMAEIHVGDLVIGANGMPTRVLGVFPQGEKDIYRVTFTDDSWAECCEDHLWTVQTPLNKWKRKPPRTLSLKEIRAKGLAHVNGNRQHFIPLVKPVQFTERPVVVEPYLLGLLLGDGRLASGEVKLTSADREIIEAAMKALPEGLRLRHSRNYDWRITTGKRGGPVANRNNTLLFAVRKMGLEGCTSKSKFIPDAYKFGAIQQRTALLQGLLDTDGHVQPNRCTVEYCTVSSRLADDVKFIVQSLGGTVTHRLKHPTYTYRGEKRHGQVTHRLFLALPDGFQPFRLKRKLQAYRPRTKYPPKRSIVSINRVGHMEARCIKVEAGDGLYVTDNCIVTHNTTIGIAIAEYLRIVLARRGKSGAYPALVVGPGIVTGKENWPKEIGEVVPGATSRVIGLGVKPLPKAAKIGAWLQDTGLSLDEKAFEGASPEKCIQLITQATRKQKVSLSDVVTAALKESLARATQDLPTRRKGAKASNLLDGRIGGYAWLGLEIPRDENSAREIANEYSLAQFIREYQDRQLPEQTFAVMSFETAKLGPGRVPAMTTRLIKVRHRDDENETSWEEMVHVCACSKCGAVVAEKYDKEDGSPLGTITSDTAEEWIGLKRRFCQAPLTYFNPRTQRYEPGKWVWDEDKGKHVIRQCDEYDEPYVCGEPLFENTALRRESAARYVLKKARRFFGLMLCDEIHKAKAKGTGVGWALTVLNNASRFTIGLTGTLFGGYSTSIFWLMYRLAGEVRREFGFNDEKRWSERFGLLKTTFYVDSKTEIVDDGAYTGTHFFETVSEKPGISPTIVGLGLKYCTFSSLKDVGLPLPAYSEEIVRLPMTKDMKNQMAEADGSGKPPQGLFRWALEEQKSETGKGAISVWLNTAFNRMDAMFRDEVVTFNRRLAGRGRFATRRRDMVRDLSAVVGAGEVLPKEEWLAKACRAEVFQGRKTLVYVRQTGSRDIQPRLTEILSSHGLRVGTLRPSLEPAKRATWMKNNAQKFDVLLTNARLVEVGLNLTMFSTAIFYQLEWSLYIIWQSMRRLYRPGAPRPVKLYFPVYEGTLEESALDLIGAKMLAAQAFYGDEVGGALVDEGDEGDLLNDLVRKAFGDLKVGRAEGIFSIGNDQLVTDSPMGSPTAISPQLVTFMDLAARRREILRGAKAKARKSANSPDGQLLMF